jgi:hypothetical protein
MRRLQRHRRLGLSAEITGTPDGGPLLGAVARNTAVAGHREVRIHYPVLTRAIAGRADRGRHRSQHWLSVRVPVPG